MSTGFRRIAYFFCDPCYAGYMPKLTIAAPAKVNLHLRITAKRPDGFHDLESLFASLDFGDTLHFEVLDADEALELRMEGEGKAAAVPPEQNIIYRAVSLFRSRTGYRRGLWIRVEKRIPLGGGLGGGSSDAASTLLALNSLAGCPLDAASLAETAAALGSDAPFFLAETGAAWVRGRGELVRPLAAPQNLWLVLVNPGFSSGTAAAFRLLDGYRAACGAQPAACPPEDELVRALAGSPKTWPFVNDFLPVFTGDSGQDFGHGSTAGAYRDMLAALGKLGADFAGLSGSGATCFGVFTDREQALGAERILSQTWKFVKYSFLLARRAIAVLE